MREEKLENQALQIAIAQLKIIQEEAKGEKAGTLAMTALDKIYTLFENADDMSYDCE
ncbi:hypothetical protein ACFO26_03750 [Lactococcus nasutitermitis]|uniref:Prophage protein n=1 Tax=Lactococcus nasutitermitis TaxID=1652957 RepID=A0ABV9JCJ6_9LACT|nr:hypothetical protein [Lactococcus nasutitermitis]